MGILTPLPWFLIRLSHGPLMAVCSGEDVQKPVPATTRGSLRLSPSSYTATTTKGPHDAVQVLVLSSLTPYNLNEAAILAPILQMWKLRLTK